jgi:hypothetical protein
VDDDLGALGREEADAGRADAAGDQHTSVAKTVSMGEKEVLNFLDPDVESRPRCEPGQG